MQKKPLPFYTFSKPEMHSPHPQTAYLCGQNAYIHSLCRLVYHSKCFLHLPQMHGMIQRK